MIRASALAVLSALFLACGTSAPAPATCSAGQNLCLPPAGGSAACTDLSADPKNCGACNAACAPVTGSSSVACHAGQCVADCGGGFGSTSKIVCASKAQADGGLAQACTDTATDHENCGACGNVCNGTQQCQAGKCVSVAGTAACGGSGSNTTYVDLRSDRANCGACGNACAANEICSGGACNPCPVAQCGGVCVDTQHDPKNCGTCGNVVANCENGAALAKITIDRNGAPFNPAVVGAPGSYTVSVKVHSQLRVVRVTATVSGTVTELSPSGPTELDATRWSGTITVPGTSTVDIVFDAYDELYQVRAADAGIVDTVHSDEQRTTATVLPLPTAAATPAAPAVQAQASQPVQVGPVFKWVPLNGPSLLFTVTVPTGQNIAQVQLLENNNVFATAPVNAAGTAVASAMPADVGLGDLSITACPLDLAGQRGPCSTATSFTVGRIAPLNAPAVIGRNADGNGSRTIYYVAPGNSQQLLGQDYVQLNSNGNDQPGQIIGGARYFDDSLRPVAEGTGVYVVKTDGSGVDRVDAPTLVKTNFAAPPASVSLRGIDLVTSAALALCDNTPASAGPPVVQNAVSYFASASPTQSTTVAVKAGVLLATGNTNRVKQACPLATATSGNFVSGGNMLQATRAGAIAGWFNNGGDVRPLLFHPAIATASHILPLMASPVAGITAKDLVVFPGGEIVFQYVDGSGASFLGAAFFDGQNQPVLLPPQQVSPSGVPAQAFLVVKPGVLLGQMPTAAGDLQAIELLASGGAIQVFKPAPSNGGTAGPLAGSAVRTRQGYNSTFAVSDDATKALFITRDQLAGAPDVVLRLHLLDLASGADTPLGYVPNGSVFHAPEFSHSAPVYSGGAPAGAHQYVVWRQFLPSSTQTTRHERISIANFQGAVSTVDRLSSYGAVDPFTVSAAAGAAFFLSETDQGGADLYAVPLASAAGPVAATRVLDHVFWFKLREDKQRLLVARSDGTVFSAPLAPGANFGQALSPLVNAGPLGDAPILNGQGIGVFGFTPDGDHAYVSRDTYASFNNRTPTGIVETIDLTTGAFARTDFGRVVGSTLNGVSQPVAGFVGGAATAVLLDQVSVESRWARLAVAPPGASTSRVDTQSLPAFYQPGFDYATFSTSVDNSEGFLQYSFNLGAPAIALGGNGVGVALEKDGSFVALPSPSLSGLSQPASFASFAGPLLPDWGIVNDLDGSLFKVWGGTPAQPFVTVSRGFAVQTNTLGTVVAPDFKELLFSFDDGSTADGYAMSLLLPGHTPPAPLLP